jgi:predicted negative regulator of RcsB-dependent stress response
VVARKHRDHETTADHMIEEFESAADRLAGWVSDHAKAVGATVVLSLAAAGGYSGWDSWRSGREQSASNALDAVESAYMSAMGAAPGALQPPELANPEAANRISAEYAERFRAVEEEHAGTVAAALAGLERGNLVAAKGDREASLQIWRAAAADTPAESSLRAILLERIAQAQEEAGQWAEAAQTHEQAGQISGFALRYWSLADAARCYATAGEPQRALALFQRVETEASELRLPVDMRLQLRELRAAAAS